MSVPFPLSDLPRSACLPRGVLWTCCFGDAFFDDVGSMPVCIALKTRVLAIVEGFLLGFVEWHIGSRHCARLVREDLYDNL